MSTSFSGKRGRKPNPDRAAVHSNILASKRKYIKERREKEKNLVSCFHSIFILVYLNAYRTDTYFTLDRQYAIHCYVLTVSGFQRMYFLFY